MRAGSAFSAWSEGCGYVEIIWPAFSSCKPKIKGSTVTLSGATAKDGGSASVGKGVASGLGVNTSLLPSTPSSGGNDGASTSGTAVSMPPPASSPISWSVSSIEVMVKEEPPPMPLPSAPSLNPPGYPQVKMSGSGFSSDDLTAKVSASIVGLSIWVAIGVENWLKKNSLLKTMAKRRTAVRAT